MLPVRSYSVRMKKRNLEAVSSFRKNLNRRKLGVTLSNASTSTVGTDVNSSSSDTPQKLRSSLRDKTRANNNNTTGTTNRQRSSSITNEGHVKSGNDDDKKLIPALNARSSCPPSPFAKSPQDIEEQANLDQVSKSVSLSAPVVKEVSFADQESHRIFSPTQPIDMNMR